jgi:hypothetical protein
MKARNVRINAMSSNSTKMNTITHAIMGTLAGVACVAGNTTWDVTKRKKPTDVKMMTGLRGAQ